MEVSDKTFISLHSSNNTDAYLAKSEKYATSYVLELGLFDKTIFNLKILHAPNSGQQIFKTYDFVLKIKW